MIIYSVVCVVAGRCLSLAVGQQAGSRSDGPRPPGSQKEAHRACGDLPPPAPPASASRRHKFGFTARRRQTQQTPTNPTRI